MKRTTKAIYASAIFCAALGFIGTITDDFSKTNSINLANIEALTETEAVAGTSIPCHSSASRDYNKAYVDCSSCTRKEGWKGTGTQASCITK